MKNTMFYEVNSNNYVQVIVENRFQSQKDGIWYSTIVEVNNKDKKYDHVTDDELINFEDYMHMVNNKD